MTALDKVLNQSLLPAFYRDSVLAMVCIDAQYRLTAPNKRWCELFSLNTDEANGKDLINMVADQDRAALREALALLVEGAKEYQVVRCVATDKLGDQKWIAIHLFAIQNNLRQTDFVLLQFLPLRSAVIAAERGWFYREWWYYVIGIAVMANARFSDLVDMGFDRAAALLK